MVTNLGCFSYFLLLFFFFHLSTSKFSILITNDFPPVTAPKTELHITIPNTWAKIILAGDNMVTDWSEERGTLILV